MIGKFFRNLFKSNQTVTNRHKSPQPPEPAPVVVPVIPVVTPVVSTEQRIRDFVKTLGYQEMTNEQIDIAWRRCRRTVESIVCKYKPHTEDFHIPMSIGNELISGFAIVFVGRSRNDSGMIDLGLDTINLSKIKIEEYVQKMGQKYECETAEEQVRSS